jgi:kynureninase
MADLFAIARDLDAADPLAKYRDRFLIDDEDLVYFDGNSLGRLPKSTRARLREVVEREWGSLLVRGWDSWMELALAAGDVLAAGALDVSAGEVVLGDSTSVNLYKLAAGALDARPGRHVIVTDDDNFPTDRYVLEGLATARGYELRMITTDIDAGVSTDAVREALDDQVALVSLSHVSYRSSARADMVAVTRAVHEVDALMLWDLSHAAGSVPVPLREAGADLAVGCTYKYLNAGPGAPAFLFVRSDLQPALSQPIWGWFGQREQFAMGTDYDPVPTIDRFLVGTPPVLGGYAALEGARIIADAGIHAIGAKSAALTEYAITLYDEWIAERGFALATPRDPGRRGAHITLQHPNAEQASQELGAANVITDFRNPERLRIGLSPLYTRFVDVHEGFRRFRQVAEKFQL